MVGVTRRTTWKFSNAKGRYFAQIALKGYPGYAGAVNNLRFLFADRVQGATVYAQLWNAAAPGSGTPPAVTPKPSWRVEGSIGPVPFAFTVTESQP